MYKLTSLFIFQKQYLYIFTFFFESGKTVFKLNFAEGTVKNNLLFKHNLYNFYILLRGHSSLKMARISFFWWGGA